MCYFYPSVKAISRAVTLTKDLVVYMHTTKYTEVEPSCKNCHILHIIRKNKNRIQRNDESSAVFILSIQLIHTQLYRQK